MTPSSEAGSAEQWMVCTVCPAAVRRCASARIRCDFPHPGPALINTARPAPAGGRLRA